MARPQKRRSRRQRLHRQARLASRRQRLMRRPRLQQRQRGIAIVRTPRSTRELKLHQGRRRRSTRHALRSRRCATHSHFRSRPLQVNHQHCQHLAIRSYARSPRTPVVRRRLAQRPRHPMRRLTAVVPRRMRRLSQVVAWQRRGRTLNRCPLRSLKASSRQAIASSRSSSREVPRLPMREPQRCESIGRRLVERGRERERRGGGSARFARRLGRLRVRAERERQTEREHTEREPHHCQSYLPAAMDAW